MKPLIVIAAMVLSLFVVPLSNADMQQGDKSKQSTEQKQADKEKDKKTKTGDTGPMGEEKTGGSIAEETIADVTRDPYDISPTVTA